MVRADRGATGAETVGTFLPFIRARQALASFCDRYPGDNCMRKLLAVLFLSALAARAGAQQASTICSDGSTSAAAARGACSGHGGIDKKATKKAADAAAKAAEKASKEAEKATKAAQKASKETTKETTKATAKATKANEKAAEAATKATTADTKAAATVVTCSDGSKGAGGRGACSGHGGIAKSNPVQKQAEKAEEKAAKEETKAAKEQTKATVAVAKAGNGSREDNNAVGAIAKCKDGLYSHSANRRGACSRHGGVATWM